MSEVHSYSAKSVYEGLLKTFHQYLRAQYHIWDEGLIAERDRLLDTAGVTHQEPRIESTPLYAAGKPYDQLAIPAAAKRILMSAAARQGTGVPALPYVHQAQAIEAFLGGSSDLIVATGTGSGKTESFLMPILGYLSIEAEDRPKSWQQPGVRALLLYPMNALVNDQLARLRRLLGDEHVAAALRGSRKHMATFGMYTSRTAYPGLRTKEKDKSRVGEMLARLFTEGMTEENRARLLKEGKWPAKDIESFATTYSTADSDCEMFTRHEMQDRSPDILVTNYSMLEYMMLRPIEANIFEQTKRWLEQDRENKFTVVLDEAHMYRGSAGAEVAFLLRRLHSRLGIPRDRVRYVLTSASLGSDEKARAAIIQFAAKLTGASETAPNFSLISGTLEIRPEGAPASIVQQAALTSFGYNSLHYAETEATKAIIEFKKLASALGVTSSLADTANVHALRVAAFELLTVLPVAHKVARQITANPVSLTALGESSFPPGQDSAEALEALLALMAFARDKQGKPFAPIRSHLFFRGLAGLYVCTNAECSGKVSSSKTSSLGRLYPLSRLRCECGARVYELLTHRACGAAYIRGFLEDDGGEFLWHEPSSGVWSDKKLVEAQFFVAGEEATSNVESVGGPLLWLATKSGQLLFSEPANPLPGEYLRVIRPLKAVKDFGRTVLTIESDCPACKRGSAGAPKAMDLATKGEAPFAHLVRTQVAMQPRLSAASAQSPNSGRKTLLFSDGRQKAARLARDIPREIELDVFRQVLILAAMRIAAIGEEPRLSGRMYTAFMSVLSDSGLQMFDGGDRDSVRSDILQLRSFFDGDLKEALDQFDKPPGRYTSLLLKQLCASNYSISALTLGFISPSKAALRTVSSSFLGLSEAELYPISVSWLQRLLEKYAFDRHIPFGIRRGAASYQIGAAAAKDGLTQVQRKELEKRGVDADKLVETLAQSMCEIDNDGGTYVIPMRVKLEVAIDKPWYQCANCKQIFPVMWWNCCSNCMSPGAAAVRAESTSYLRARKGFWRDPVAGAIAGTDELVNLSVEEHTAQLSYKDVDEPTTTTEEFERRFRDILVRPSDTSIDVLSCTTTMEVGIDIGSLVAVGMRNVPPMRQNYQQRAGRAGRRGTSISTVMTYAQNGAHDSYYFDMPDAIISGDPPRPILDTDNVRIATRHVHAQLVQDFFRPRAETKKSGDIFTSLGDTWIFFTGNGNTSLLAFKNWISESVEAKKSLERASAWLPKSFPTRAEDVAAAFVAALEAVRPSTEDGLDENLIDFLFNKSLLPSYAFPRDICALQIERFDANARINQVKIEEKPQQSLNVALSEYAPGRLVVVNKKTYRVGTVAANSLSTEVDRAVPLFDRSHNYIHCEKCLFTSGFTIQSEAIVQCPQCGSGSLRSVIVVTPETVFPRGKKEINEFDDEQQFSQTTGAQLPLADLSKPLDSTPFGARGALAFQRLQPLVMVNMGAARESQEDGFRICDSCGRVLLDGEIEAPHERDYMVQRMRGRPPVPVRCNGSFQHVYLGYKFTSDVLLLRFKIESPMRFSYLDTRKRRPLEDALQSLSEALVLAMSRVLDIDSREVSAGFRFASSLAGENFADIFVYDTLSGGAGYAFQAGSIFEDVYAEAERLLAHCDCDKSCEKCLRHYGNRFHHGILDRHLALDIASYIRSGLVPTTPSAVDQKVLLEPLAQMLTLAGWDVGRGTTGPLQVGKAHRSLEVSICPSLVDCTPRERRGNVTSFTFTPYELDRDLSSAFAELS